MTKKTDKDFKKFVEEQQQMQLESDRQAAKLRAKVTELNAKNKRLLKEIEEVESRLDVALSVSGKTKSVPKIKPKSKSKQIREGCPVLLCSDWHVGEIVDPKTVNGRNKFTPELAKVRATRLWRGSASVINMWETGYKITEAIMWLGGDLITGYIHDELMESNALSPSEEILLVKELVSQGIEYLLENTSIEKLIVPCNYGNHGRTTNKRRVSTGAKNSFEWLLYKILEQQYENDSRVEFIVADGPHLYLDVYDSTLRLHHGDDVRYWGGVGGLATPMRKAVDKWNDFQHADITNIGHYHTCQDYGDSVINGSLIGYGPFALSIKARYEPAAQALYLMDKRFGKRMLTPIIVEDESDLT